MALINLVFGTLNLYAFGSISTIGFLSFFLAHIYSRRTIEQIWIHKDGKFVDFKFFNAFWKPQTKTYSIYDFGDKFASFYTMTKIDSTSSGFIYINLEANIYKGNTDYENMLDDILNGVPISIGSNKTNQPGIKNRVK